MDNKISSKFKYSLIFNLSNNKLIGILKNISNNKGIFFNEIIKRFLHNKHKPKPLIKNEIEIIIKVDKDEDIGKEIYFLANKYYDIKEHKYILCHERMKELDYYNPELYINNIKYKYNKCFKPKTKGEYLIKIIINFYLTDCSFMFSGCGNIKLINLSNFNTKYVNNIQKMFNECTNLEYINLASFNTANVTDMSYMFCKCYSLNNLNLSNFNTKKVINKAFMFCQCLNLQTLYLPSFNSNNDDISKIFQYGKDYKSSDLYHFSKRYNISSLNKNKLKSRYKVFFIGDSNNGAKTSLINRIV